MKKPTALLQNSLFLSPQVIILRFSPKKCYSPLRKDFKLSNSINSKKGQAQPGCLFGCGIPLLVFGLGIIFTSLWAFVTYARSGSWEKVDAIVTQASVQRSVSNRGGVSYYLVGKYKYEFNGKKYTGTRLFIDSSPAQCEAALRHEIQKMESHLKSGKPMKIFVNPSNPEDTIVFRQLGISVFLMPILGVILLFPGYVFLVEGIGKIRR